MFSYENDEMVVDDISSSVLKNRFAGHRAVTVYTENRTKTMSS